ncbi:MAG: glycosyltransferase family 2 protein [bacterium]|nr:glycosyltransferase family 2 protein [bacterium]
MKRPVSVYIPAYNVEKYLATCIEYIQKQTYPVSEILVIDDGSTDTTADIAKQYPVKLIQHQQNQGLAAVRNTGVKNAKYDYVASLDADCIPEPDWLERLMVYFDQEQVAGVSGKLIEKHQTDIPDRWRAIHMKQYWEGEEVITNPMHLFGNNTVFYRPALAEVGFYKDTPEYRTNNEDYYISRKLLEAGYTIIYDPKSVVYHLRHDNYTSLFRTYWRWFFLHRPRPDSIRGFLHKGITNLVYFRNFLREDLDAGRFNLIIADCLFLWYQTVYDIKFAITRK